MSSEIIFLVCAFLLLILLGAFFSSCETGMLSVNRYRLKHQAKISKAAKRTQTLLERPDRLLGVILLGGTFVNSQATSIGTLIAMHFLDEQSAVIVAPIVLTLVILIFAEVSPKTLAAIYPEKVALPASFILTILLKLLYPLVWSVNTVANSILALFGISLERSDNEGISREELRTVVFEATGRIPNKHRLMLLSILDLEKVTVDDIMIPRHDLVGIDLTNPWSAVVTQIVNTQHTFLPVYQQDINNIIGVLHIKKILHLIAKEDFNQHHLRQAMDEAFFIPQGTTLTKQLLNFQKSKQRFALVVDEYGDILGLVTLEDILEEIVGEYTTNVSESYASIVHQEDGSYLMDGSTSIRECNRIMDWKLPTDGPKTINGLVLEYLQMIPEPGTCCLINKIPVEVVQVQDNRIKTIKVLPPLPHSV